MTRVELLRRAVAAGVGLSSLSLLAACGDGGDAEASGEVGGALTVLNYPDWIGPGEVERFERKYPKADITETTDGYESLAGVSQKIAQNPKAYDVAMLSIDQCQQLEAGGFVEKPGEDSLPNLAAVEPRFRELFPWGLPLDTGSAIIGYRKDRVKDRPTSWQDFWRLAEQHSGRVVMTDVDRNTLGTALIMLGLDPNTSDEADLQEAKAALLQIKPHIRAFKVTDLAKDLSNDNADLVSTYNWELAAAAAEDPNIGIVVPEDGATAFLEGMAVITATDNRATADAFVNARLDPQNYAGFINKYKLSRTSKAADKLLDKPLLTQAYEVDDNATFVKYTGADGVKAWNRAWSEFKAA